MAAESGIRFFAGDNQKIAVREARAAFKVNLLLVETNFAGIRGMRIGVKIAQRGNVNAQRLKGGNPLRLMVESAGVGQFLIKMKMKVTYHHLVAGHGLIYVVVRERHDGLLGSLRIAGIQVEIYRHPLHGTRWGVVESEILLEFARLRDAPLPYGIGHAVRLERFLAVGLPHAHGERGVAVLAVIIVSQIGFHFARKEELVGRRENRYRSGAAFHHREPIARLEHHRVGIDFAAEQVVLPAARRIAPNQASSNTYE